MPDEHKSACSGQCGECASDPIKVIIAYCQRQIRKQRKMIKKAGHEPTWSLFEKTFAWYRMKKQFSPTMQSVWRNLWLTEDMKDGLITGGNNERHSRKEGDYHG